MSAKKPKPDKPRRVLEWEANWNRVSGAVKRVADAGPKMLELSELPSDPDGYPARSIGDGVASASPDTSTERAALADYPDDDPDKHFDDNGEPIVHPGPNERVSHLDRVDAWVAEFFAHDLEVRKRVAKMDRIARLVGMRAEYKDRMEAKGGHCRACQRFVSGTVSDDEDGKVVPDRLRNLLCNACYTAWCRWKGQQLADTGDAPMNLFLVRRRADLEIDEEGNCVHCGRTRESVDHDQWCLDQRRVAG